MAADAGCSDISDADQDALKTANIESMKNMSAEELQRKVDSAKEKQRLEVEAEASRQAARLAAIDQCVAAGKAAFAAGDYEEAERQFDKALIENPSNRVELVCNRAACALKMGRFADAVSDAAEAASMEPTYVKAHYRLALAQQGLGKIERALAACRTGLEQAPENAQLLKLEAELVKAVGVEGGNCAADERAGGTDREGVLV